MAVAVWAGQTSSGGPVGGCASVRSGASRRRRRLGRIAVTVVKGPAKKAEASGVRRSRDLKAPKAAGSRGGRAAGGPGFQVQVRNEDIPRIS